MKSDSQQNVWVYGAVPAGASLEELERRSQLPEVWIVESGDLGAIVGDAPAESAKATRDQALAHARVLEAAVVDAPVVPFRFGTEVQGGDEAVGREVLEAYHEDLSKRLKAVEEVVQMSVKATYDEQAVLTQIIGSEPELAALQRQARNGSKEATHGARLQFGELLYQALDLRREHDSAEIVERLKPMSIAFAPEEIETEFQVLNVPFLVKRDRLDKFEEAVEQEAENRRETMRFSLLGPMPAYNFLDVAAAG